MLGKLFSGLQTVKIDTKLDSVAVQSGGTLSGMVVFGGADSDKKINRLSLHLQTLAEVESGDSEYTQALDLAVWVLEQNFVVRANETLKVPFSLSLPYELPITELNCYLNKSKVWVQTHLDVDWGLDSQDKDYLVVRPTPVMADFITAMTQCGFVLHSADVEKGFLNGGYFRSTIGCYQELEFKPKGLSSIGEVEVSFVPTPTQTHIVLEIDRRRFFGSQDHYRTLTIDHNVYDVQALQQQLMQMLG